MAMAGRINPAFILATGIVLTVVLIAVFAQVPYYAANNTEAVGIQKVTLNYYNQNGFTTTPIAPRSPLLSEFPLSWFASSPGPSAVIDSQVSTTEHGYYTGTLSIGDTLDIYPNTVIIAVVTMTEVNGPTLPFSSDSVGLSYTEIAQQGGNYNYVEVYVANVTSGVASGTSDTIDFYGSSSYYDSYMLVGLAIYDVAGITTSGAVVSYNTNGATSPVNASTFQAYLQGFTVGALGTNSGTSTSAGAGYTLSIGTDVGGDYGGIYTEYSTSVSGTTNASFSGKLNYWLDLAVSFKNPSAPPSLSSYSLSLQGISASGQYVKANAGALLNTANVSVQIYSKPYNNTLYVLAGSDSWTDVPLPFSQSWTTPYYSLVSLNSTGSSNQQYDYRIQLSVSGVNAITGAKMQFNTTLNLESTMYWEGSFFKVDSLAITGGTMSPSFSLPMFAIYMLLLLWAGLAIVIWHDRRDED